MDETEPLTPLHPDHVRAHRLEGAQGGADLGSEQHPPRQFDRHLHLERDADAGARHGPAAGLQRGLRLQDVVARLDEEKVREIMKQLA